MIGLISRGIVRYGLYSFLGAQMWSQKLACHSAGTDGVSQTYDGYLVGSDRSKDLAVVKINAPRVSTHTL